jgi:hypothetical protein
MNGPAGVCPAQEGEHLMSWLHRHGSALALCGALLCAGQVGADDKKGDRAPASFGTLQSATPELARAQASDWLKAAGKTAQTQAAFEAVWNSDRPVLDKVAETLSLGDDNARKLLQEARDGNLAPPTAVPALLKDAKRPAFYRANLALAYAKALSQRRIYEEALETLNAVKVEQVVDPASYLFHKAVAEHALLKAREANNTIVRLLDDVSDPPERYKMVAALMVIDMISWKDRDLGAVARKMDNIERRLDLTRGGPVTQKLQKDVIARLDELIKEKENQAKGCGS